MLVIDASVVIKLYVREAGSERAAEKVGARGTRFVPAHAFAEVGEALARKVRMGALGEDQISPIVAALRTRFVVRPLDEILPTAMALALSTGASVYDCLYVALAAREGCPLVTADARLVAKFAATRYAGLLETL